MVKKSGQHLANGQNGILRQRPCRYDRRNSRRPSIKQ